MMVDDAYRISNRTSGLSDRALEMIMRDVLDGLLELATSTVLRSGAEGCRILTIEPARPRSGRAPPTSLGRGRGPAPLPQEGLLL